MTETSLVNVSISEEPSAVVPHARICEGTVWATGGSTSINSIVYLLCYLNLGYLLVNGE